LLLFLPFKSPKNLFYFSESSSLVEESVLAFFDVLVFDFAFSSAFGAFSSTFSSAFGAFSSTFSSSFLVCLF